MISTYQWEDLEEKIGNANYYKSFFICFDILKEYEKTFKLMEVRLTKLEQEGNTK